MAQQSSIRLLGGSVDGPLDGVVRLVTAALALVLAITVIGLLVGGRPLSTESMRSPSSAAGLAYSAPNGDAMQASSDDGYLEGLAKALDHDF